MALIRELLGKTPKQGKDCWFAETAVVIGDVTMGDNCSIWYNAVLRGDVNSITIGHNSNVQDNAMIHCTYLKAPTVIGNHVSIGHNAIVHGCTLEDNVLIGMGAIVMDHVVVGTGSIVGAGAVVLENTIIEPGSVYVGNPARKVKDIGDKGKAEIQRIAGNYLKYSSWYK
ncbi:gamma carbonic anhydrase family protein [Reichenbachiella sp. MSK19-1]|uniref:gamma carbonic anhydrase family protein n=1 Tax=Reichenbachiella sp. MSK19-1 TaxID=1897631 RepID=UPI000E6CAE1D|nr:gamma carbonic anhydrase family protein [Reichenbachiella sp. MSK19-1]RJE72644.1 gamma carbonic anhydrase family protein [Reichenbachiella sp. MSK19-1]